MQRYNIMKEKYVESVNNCKSVIHSKNIIMHKIMAI